MNQNKIPASNISYLLSIVTTIIICAFLIIEGTKLGFEGLFKRPLICIFLFPISVVCIMSIREFVIDCPKVINNKMELKSKKTHILSLIQIFALSVLLVSEWSKMGLEKLTTRPVILFSLITFALSGLIAFGELLRVMIKSKKGKKYMI